MSELERLQHALEQERAARREAEQIILQKSAELRETTDELLQLNRQLEQDIKARTEESLLLARLPEEIPDPIMRISRYGTITYTNSAYRTYWAPTLQHAEGDPYPPFLQEDIDQAIVSRSPHIAEHTVGEQSWSVQFNAVEQYGYVNIIARNITPQKKAEEKIRKSQEALLEAQELGNLGQWEFNMETAQFTWSPQLFRQYGLEPAEAAPSGGDFFLFIYSEDLPLAQDGVSKALEEGYAQFEHRIVRPDGSLRHLYTTVRALHDAEGEPSRIYGTSLDVTELRHTEAQLRESEERFQLALQGMNDGLWDWDLLTGSLYLSPQWKSLLGYQDHELENSWNTVTRFIVPEDRDRLINLIYTDNHELDHKVSFEFQIMHRNGTWRTMMARCIILSDKQGRRVRMVGANSDITERIQAEKKLLNSLDQINILSKVSFMFNSLSEDFEQPIQEAIGMLGAHSGASRVYIFENSSDGVFASNTFEWCQEGVEPLIESLQNVPYSAMGNFHRTLKKQGTVASDVRSLSPAFRTLLNKTGVKSLMIMPFHVQDEFRGFVGFDDCSQHRQWEPENIELLRTFANLLGTIFERQQAEYKVISSEEKYRSLVDNLTEVIFQTDQQNKLIFLNPAWHEIMGYTGEESLNTQLLEYIVEEDRQEFASLQKLLFEHKIDFCRQVMRLQIKGGAIRYVEIFARLLEGKWGQAEGLSGTLTDVTNQQLTNEKLIKAKEVAEKASLIKAQFLSVMSHEIRTPLNAMLGIAHLLIRQQPRADQEENLRMLKFSGENLLSLINDILDFNKIESGRITIEKSLFNLKKLCHSLQKALSLKANEKNVTLQLEIDTQIPALVVGDSTRLTQILNNLLDNAVKFTHQGTVKLSIKALDIQENAITLQFLVSDTGIGIPQEAQSRIFEAFTQVHQHSNHEYGGTGLGLAIIKRLLALQDSKIDVSSTPGKGSEFKFSLRFDLVSEQELFDTLEAEPTPSTQDLQQASLLLVEDNPLNMLVLVQFFEIWGVQPDVAENGLQALEKIRGKTYDLVLMDLHMPELDGIDTTQHIRKELNLTDLPIIALTANALPGIRQKVLDAGMNDYISKPFEPEDLFQKVVRYLPQAKRNAPEKPLQQQPKEETNLYSLKKLYNQSNQNPEFVRRMVALFIKTCHEQLPLIQTSLESGEASLVRDIAHKLKPSIDLFEISSQKKNVRRLELMELSEMLTPDGWQVAEGLINSLFKVTHQLQEWLSEQASIHGEK